jgi:nucleoside-diphosphate-sugar epimerase
MRVLVTGAAGHLAQVLLPVLCNEREIQRVIGIDRAAVAVGHRKLLTLRTDLASAAACQSAREADAVVHLASTPPSEGVSVQRAISAHLVRTRTFLGAAADAGVSRIVFLSSAAVYGSGENLSEEALLKPLSGFALAQPKAECEHWMAAQLPHAVRLRPHLVLGPHARPLLKMLCNARIFPRVADPAPQLQCVHELDVAQAVRQALRRDAGGAYNLAAPQTFSLQALVESRHPHAIRVPLGPLSVPLWLARRSGRWSGEPYWQAWMGRTLTLDCRRADTVLGWRPRFDDWRAIVAATFAPH